MAALSPNAAWLCLMSFRSDTCAGSREADSSQEWCVCTCTVEMPQRVGLNIVLWFVSSDV